MSLQIYFTTFCPFTMFSTFCFVRYFLNSLLHFYFLIGSFLLRFLLTLWKTSLTLFLSCSPSFLFVYFRNCFRCPWLSSTWTRESNTDTTDFLFHHNFLNCQKIPVKTIRKSRHFFEYFCILRVNCISLFWKDNPKTTEKDEQICEHLDIPTRQTTSQTNPD
jgi:hypothetical protein